MGEHTRIDPYADGDAPVWSGNPNHALVTELQGVAPGRALDVGSGEGADAVWLARQGWDAVGLEPSAKGLDRARAAAQAAGVEIEWVESTLEDAALPPASFDLVSAFYAPLFRTPERRAERRLAGLVAPGGLLLAVHHKDFNPEKLRERGIDPDDFLKIPEIADSLGDGWTVELLEERDRDIAGGEGAHHRTDVVLRARKHD